MSVHDASIRKKHHGWMSRERKLHVERRASTTRIHLATTQLDKRAITAAEEIQHHNTASAELEANTARLDADVDRRHSQSKFCPLAHRYDLATIAVNEEPRIDYGAEWSHSGNSRQYAGKGKI